MGLDYGYLSEDRDAQPILFGRDDRDHWLYALALPAKGSAGDFSWRAPMAMLSRSGFAKFVMRTDGEPAMVAQKLAIIKGLKDGHGIEVVPETTSRAESQSNGLAEAAVKQGKAKARTLFQVLCDNLGWRVPAFHPALAWLPSYAASTVNVGRPNADGRTPFRSRHGRDWTKAVASFGESVLYSPIGRQASRWSERAQPGIFLDIDFERNAYWIGTPHGVERAATFHRHPRGAQYNLELFKAMAGVPWAKTVDQQRVARPISVAPAAVVAEASLPPAVVAEPAPARRVYLRKDVELRRHGYTDHCPGCTAAAVNGPPTTHSEACRARIEHAMAQDTERGGSGRVAAAADRAADAGADAAGTPAAASPDAGAAAPGVGDDVAMPGAAGAAASSDVAMQGARRGRPRTAKRSAEVAGLPNLDPRLPADPWNGLAASPAAPAAAPPAAAPAQAAAAASAMNTAHLEIDELATGSSAEGANGDSPFSEVPGGVFDLKTGFDLSVKEDKDRAREELQRLGPRLVVGSSYCAQGQAAAEKEHVEALVDIYHAAIDKRAPLRAPGAAGQLDVGPEGHERPAERAARRRAENQRRAMDKQLEGDPGSPPRTTR